MARIRTVKPEFWTDEKVVELSAFARLLFIGLWNFCDDEGRMVYSPKRIKMQIFPADNLEISELFGELRGASLITMYTVENIEYLQINNFTKHQKIDKRTASRHPCPPNPAELPRIPTTDSIKEGNGMDQGMEVTTLSGKQPDATPLNGKRNYKAEAVEVLEFLNKTTGRNYRPVEATIKPIMIRLKSGVTAQDCRTVIIRKWRDWHRDEKMEKYLRPKTIFAAANFENYLGECVAK